MQCSCEITEYNNWLKKTQREGKKQGELGALLIQPPLSFAEVYACVQEVAREQSLPYSTTLNCLAIVCYDLVTKISD